MSTLQRIKESAISQLVSSISGVLILLLGIIFPNLFPSIFQYIIQNLSKEALLQITSLAIILSILLAVLSFALYLKSKNTLIPRFGVLWDKNKEPHCPSCKTYLSGYTELPKAFYFVCHGHEKRKEVYMHNDGVPISLDNARKLL